MCDDLMFDDDASLADRRLNRRQVGLGAGATLAAVLTSCASSPKADPASPGNPPAAVPSTVPAPSPPDENTPLPTTASRVSVPTPDGAAEAFFVKPDEGGHPGVIFWPDIAGLRPAFETMATRLAEAGYAVLAVNHYYRTSKLPIFKTFSDWRTPEGQARIQPMRAALTPAGVVSDATAFAGWLNDQAGVDSSKRLATCGYCMSGPYALRTAAALRERVGAFASFHGAGLVSEEPTSPHLLLSQVTAAALICIARNDHQNSPEAKPTLERAAERFGIPHEIEVYPAQHGWCVLDSPSYDREQAERAWARMLAVFERTR